MPTASFRPISISRATAGWLSASISSPGGEQFVRVWSLDKVLAGDMTAMSEFRLAQSSPEGFVFSPDGRYLFGSAYYTGVSNIFRYEVETGKVEAVSNAETGFFRPVPLSDGRMVVFSFSGAGFRAGRHRPDAAEGRELHPLSRDRSHEAASGGHDVAGAATGGGRCEEADRGGGRLPPARKPPPAERVSRAAGLQGCCGGRLSSQPGDELGYASLGIVAAYTPSDSIPGRERGHIMMRANYLNWRADLAWNRSDFYDLFGPTKRSRKGYAAKFGNTQSLIFDTPRTLDLITEVAFYDKIGALPNAQNIEAGFDSLVTAEVGLRYSNVRRSLGAVDDEKGTAGTAVLTTSTFEGTTVPQLRATFDFGLALPPHSSVWSRTSVGVAHGDRSDSAANFYFGAYGNNYVDDGNVKRYREYYAMPGFGINELSAQRFVKQMVEWNLAPYIFERAGMPDFFLQSLRPAVFASGLWTDPLNSKSESRRAYSNVGGQVDLQVLGAALVRDDAVGRLCRRFPELASRGGRVDDLPEDPVASPIAR